MPLIFNNFNLFNLLNRLKSRNIRTFKRSICSLWMPRMLFYGLFCFCCNYLDLLIFVWSKQITKCLTHKNILIILILILYNYSNQLLCNCILLNINRQWKRSLQHTINANFSVNRFEEKPKTKHLKLWDIIFQDYRLTMQYNI